MGTEIQTDFGAGVTIKRIEGIGNGGNATAFNAETEDSIVANTRVVNPIYREGEGPVKVRVIDPLKIQPADWELFIDGPSLSTDSTRGIAAKTGGWHLIIRGDVKNDTVYSERNLVNQNEQLLEKYGLSINISQTARPGDSTAVKNGLISSDITFADPNNIWLIGVPDGEQQSSFNWIRSGNFEQPKNLGVNACNYADIGAPYDNPDPEQVYENLLPGSTGNKGTWAPVKLGAVESKGECGFGVVNSTMLGGGLTKLQGVDVVFTSDKTKWTRCLVLELQDDPGLSEGHVSKFGIRSHRSWNGDLDDNGRPKYSADANDTGFSYFPGYAINTETGERLNIVFGEDSYLKQDNGSDLLWNPSSRFTDSHGGVVFGGKHYIYVQNTRYDKGQELYTTFSGLPDYRSFSWMSLPIVSPAQGLRPLSEGLIPTETRVRIRVTTPYGRFIPDGVQPAQNNGNPFYTFSTRNMAPRSLADAANRWNNDKDGLLEQIMVTPNPYYGYTGYETGRLNTTVRIINLPRKATINIYSTDGTLIRTLTKDDPNKSYVDWDIRNAKGLSIASGMYLFHVQADGIGEKVVRWFGAMRPVDLTNY
jgi:hypothetical protein